MFDEIWDAVTTVYPAPAPEIVLGTALAGLALVLLPGVWPLSRHLVTVMHEGGHAFIALLAGRKLSGIKLHSDTSGLTVSRGKPRGVGVVFSLLAGYIAPGLVGLGAAFLLAAGRPVLMLWILLALLALLLLQIRNFFGLWIMAVIGFGVFAVTWWASLEVQQIAAYVVAWFLLLAAPRPVLEMQRARRRGGRSSDADQLAKLTFLPGIAWVGIFLLITCATALVGASVLTAHLR